MQKFVQLIIILGWLCKTVLDAGEFPSFSYPYEFCKMLVFDNFINQHFLENFNIKNFFEIDLLLFFFWDTIT